ncbi:MAG: hypothetical protein Q8R37_01010 [Nanoarchaeota archaeon]|nr:hypothetical protein [Nanoarchaeota archaeon]
MKPKFYNKMYINPIRTYIFLLLKDGEYTAGSGYNRVELQFLGGLEEAINRAKQEGKKMHTTLPKDFPETWQGYEVIPLGTEWLPMPPGQNLTYARYYYELVRS